MSESTLIADYTKLQKSVGFFLGFGRDPETWAANQTESVAEFMESGIRKVYFCGYKWSFLRPTHDFALDNGKRIINLPHDFGGLEGHLSIFANNSSAWEPIPVVGEGTILANYARLPETTGPPECVAIVPLKGSHAQRSQEFEIHVWPQADRDYILRGQYYFAPSMISGKFPYLYGGVQHAEMYLSSCKAVAELDADDEPGPQAQEFMRLLEISKELDGRNKPQVHGKMRDRSDDFNGIFPNPHWRPGVFVTFDGILWD